MRTFYFPTQDASIYSQFPTLNTGLDEQLEFGKTNDGIDIARALVQFDLISISASIASGDIPFSASFDFILYTSNATNLIFSQSIFVQPISQSWVEGTGYFFQNIVQTNDGVSWNSARSGSNWATTGSDFLASPTSQISTGKPVGDLTFNVNTLVQAVVSGTLPNDGWLVKFDAGAESNPLNQGNFKSFSSDTHTIYKPVLVAKWNDQIYSTGSLVASPTSSLLVVPGTLKSAYTQNDVVRVNLFVRENYPLKTFNTTFTNFDGLRYLPTSSYFSITDVQSGVVIIPFDDNSRVSVDPVGSYFTFKVQNMYPRRYYKVAIKVVHDGLTEIFDDGYIFTIR